MNIRLWLLGSVMAQVGLTIALLFALGGARFMAVRRREVQLRDVATRGGPWPARIVKLGDAFQNQFETPVLFYLVSVLALFGNTVSLTFVVLAWTWLVLRVVHLTIHVTSNRVTRRFAAFLLGLCVLVAMWVTFAANVVTSLRG